MKTLKLKSSAVITAAVLLSACSIMPKLEQPQVAVPDTFKFDVPAQEAVQAASLGWQDYFADPRLHRLIEIALQRNTDLRAAALNSEAVRKQYMISRAAELPGINASGSGSRSGGIGSNNIPTSSSYRVGLGITGYELDLFGKAHSQSEAALQNYFATAAARDSAHLSLVAAVAKAYFNERYAEESMVLAERVLKSRQQTYRLTQLKHKAGVVSAVDLRQQEALIESAKSDYAKAAKGRETARNALAMLLNRPIPDDLPNGLPLNKQFKISRLPAGLTSEVLLNRPDIRAAEFALKQANANIGAARAAFFPSISLTTTVGIGSNELGKLFSGSNAVWAFAPSINLPIFNWGSLQASLDAAEIRKQIQVVNYEGAVQAAFRDVSDALVARAQLDHSHEAAVRQAKAYSETRRLVGLRYKHGVASALALLDAERSSYAADSAVLASSLSRLENMADLYKALGGGLKRFTHEPAAQ
ncbi:MAG: efflux transporter outer membrane subunit [Neisseria sp.]|nr:efflux transporter outer membrane subunit [Neisseria sp.]